MPRVLVAVMLAAGFPLQLSAQTVSTADPSVIVTSIEVPSEGSMSPFTVGDGTAWLLAKHKLFKVDPTVNQFVAVPVEEISRYVYGLPTLATGGGSVWVFGSAHKVGGIHRIDPATGNCVASIHLEKRKGETSLAYGAGALWVLNQFDGTLLRIDPGTNQIAATIQVGKGYWDPVQVDDGAVWVMGLENGVVKRVDPQANRVADEFSAGSPHENGLLSEATKGGTYSFSVGQGVVWIFDDWHGRIFNNDMKAFEIAIWGVDARTHERIGNITRGVLGGTPMFWNGWLVTIESPVVLRPATATDHAILLPPITKLGEGVTIMAGDDALWSFGGNWRFGRVLIRRVQPKHSGQSKTQP